VISGFQKSQIVVQSDSLVPLSVLREFVSVQDMILGFLKVQQLCHVLDLSVLLWYLN